MSLLTQFLLRLSFGLAVGMGITSSKQVTSGYFRNHLYVTLGLAALAALLTQSVAPEAFWYAVLAAGASYVGAVCWLYEKAIAGKTMLVIVALASLLGVSAISAATSNIETDSVILSRYFPVSQTDSVLTAADARLLEQCTRRMGYWSGGLRAAATATSGLLLGITMATMLLGHWYLNSPTMELAPLRRLLLAMGVAVVLQMIVSALGLWCEVAYATRFSSQWLWFVILRWAFGLLGVAVLVGMAWQTLKVPNTQSATGILYVAVIGTFVGETMALLLSAESLFPL